MTKALPTGGAAVPVYLDYASGEMRRFSAPQRPLPPKPPPAICPRLELQLRLCAMEIEAKRYARGDEAIGHAAFDSAATAIEIIARGSGLDGAAGRALLCLDYLMRWARNSHGDQLDADLAAAFRGASSAIETLAGLRRP